MSLKIFWTHDADTTAGYPVARLRDPAPHAAASDSLSGIETQAISRLVLTSAFVFLAWRVWFFALAVALDPSATVDMVLDDAYYYLQIAYNVVLHGRSSYDGLTDTNGYQPAWMGLIVAIEALLRLDKKGLFVALHGLMFLAMALPLLFCVKRARNPFYLSLAAGLTASYAVYPGVFSAGLETVLFAPAFVAVAHAARKGLRASAKRVSWVFALIVLIRLDALSLLIAYSIPLAYGWWKSAGLGRALLRLAKFGLPSALSLGLYALTNWLAFGQPVPISGMAKGLGAPLFANWGILLHYMVQAVPLALVGLVLLAIEFLWIKFEGGRFVYGGLGILAGSVSIHYLFFAGFSGWIPWPWYFYTYALMLVLVVARLVAIALELAVQPAWAKPLRPQLVALCSVALTVLVFPALTHAAVTVQIVKNVRNGGEPSGSFNRRNAADALAFDARPDSERKEPLTVAIGDRAAGLGYWSPDDVRVFALEGLVTSKAYLDARQRNEGEAWVRAQIQPRYLIVDREELEPVRIGNVERYVVIEPIQGRVVFDHLLTYCFPTDAVVRQTRGRDDQVMVLSAPAVRTTFDMRKAEQCTGAFADHVRATILSTDSLRRTGVAVEYKPEMGGDINAAMEHFDRSLALRLRAANTKADAAGQQASR